MHGDDAELTDAELTDAELTDAELRALRVRIQGGLALDIEDLLRILPHRPPFLLLDRVIALVPGQHAVASKRVGGREKGLATPYGGFVFPSTLVVEALAQLGELVASGIAVPAADRSAAPRRDGEDWPRLAAIASSEVHQEMLDPGSIDLTVSRTGTAEDGTIEFVGQASLDGAPFVDARFSIRP